MILVAIPVYQRGELVRHCFATIAELELPAGSEVHVFDDASPSLDVAALMKATGLEAGLERSAKRLGADGMVAHIWRRFLDSTHEYLLFVDSDMIANRDAVTVGLELMQCQDGLLSLYNSSLHKGKRSAPGLLRKDFVGNAGTLWSRRLAELALAEIGAAPAIDFEYGRLFARLNTPLLVVEQSRLQHLGIVGVHNRYFGTLDHGLGFVPDAPAQWRAIGFAYDELMRRQEEFLRPEDRSRPSGWLPWRKR